MRSRRAKWIVRGLLLLLALLIAGGVAGWRWLPRLLERQAVAALRAQGLREPALRVRSFGLAMTELADVSARGTNWTLQLDHGWFRYHLRGLLKSRLDAIELDGLRVELAPFAGTPPAPAPPVPPDTPLLDWLPARLPVGRLRVTNGVLTLRHAGQTRALPFHAAVTEDPTNHALRGRLASRAPEQWLRLEGTLARAMTSRVAVAFEVGHPEEWLAFALGATQSAAGLVQWRAPLAGTLRAEIAPGASEATLAADLAPLRLELPAGALTVKPTTAATRAGRNGVKTLHLRTGLEFVSPDGWRAALPEVALAFTAPGRLETRLTGLRAAFANLIALTGNFRLTVEDVTAGAAAGGRLTLDDCRLGLPGIRLAPFTGEVWGNRDRVEFHLPCLSATNGPPWRLTEVRGEVNRPLSLQTRARVSGQITVSWPAALGPSVPLPFTLELQRRGVGAQGTGTLRIQGVRPPFSGSDPRDEVQGRLTITADYRPDHSRFGTDFELNVPRIATAAWDAEAASLTGTARITAFPESGVPLPGLLRPLAASLPGWPQTLPADGTIMVRLRARRLALRAGWTLDKPELRLERPLANTAPRACWAALSFQADRIRGADLLLTEPHARAALTGDRLTVTGGVKLAEQPLPFQMQLALAKDASPAKNQTVSPPPASTPVFTGQTRWGPVFLTNFALPAAWTGGSALRVTGRIELEARGRGRAGALPELAGKIRLDLARLEDPGSGLILEGLSGALTLASLEPLRSVTNDCFTLRRLRWRDREITNIILTLRCQPGPRFQVQLVNANLLGGRIWTPPFVVDGRTGDFAAHLELAHLDLRRLSREIPHWAGHLEGRIGGTLAVRRKNGHWQPQASRLELDTSVPARVQYPADGLLTGSLDPDSPRYQQLKLVEEGLKNLTLQTLRVRLMPPEIPDRVASIRLEGVSTSDRVIVPVILTINLNGSLKQLLRMLEHGNFEISF